MAPRTTTARVRELAEAAAKTAAGGSNPLTRNRRRAETAEERVATLQAQRERLLRERDAARAEVEKLRQQAEVLREQRNRGRASAATLAVLTEALGLDPAANVGGKRLRQALNQLRADGLIADGLLQGQDLDEALVRAVRALLANPQSISRARALCAALQADDRTRVGGTVALGHYLLVWGSRKTAHAQFSQAPLDLLVRTAAVAAVTSAWHVDAQDGERLAGEIVEHPALPAADAFALAGVLVGHHRLSLARRALERARSAPDLDDATAQEVARLQDWLDTHAPDLDTVSGARSRSVLGVLHYEQPRWSASSDDLGDYTQSVAMLGHVLRRRGLRLHPVDADLQTAFETIRSAVPEEHALDSPEAHLDVVTVSRDSSRWEVLPERTWLVTYGWYLHSIFGVRTDLPFHPAIRPVFLSFHVGRPEVLTPEAATYLQRYGPVGCRDWTTVDLLMSHGVDAFFSGCLTTTTHLAAGRRNPDAAASEGAAAAGPTGAGTTEDLRVRLLGEDLVAAHERNLALRGSAEPLQTADLHEYLPAVSMGLQVEFEPPNPSDPRLDGLSGLTPGSGELSQMQQRLTDLMDLVVDALTSGADEDAVYSAWRQATRPLVEQARARRANWKATVPAVESLAGAAAPVREAAAHMAHGGADDPRSDGRDGEVHVAIALDQNLVDAAPVVLQGIEENTGRDVRVHVLTRGVPTDTVRAWAGAFPRLRFSHYRFDDVFYGAIARMLSHTTVSTMDRLLLPDVLTDLSRVVYIDIDVTVLGDVGELWDLDLAGAPLAARPTASEWAESGLAFIYRAALRLPVEVAQEFRAFMHARLDGDFVSFNAGILVLDLARMRADEFSAHFAGMAGRYGLNDQDVLCCYAGTGALALDPRWNTFPTREPVPDDARLVHFAGGTKPWQTLPVPAKDLWLAARDRWLARVEACGAPV